VLSLISQRGSIFDRPLRPWPDDVGHRSAHCPASGR
jgi:hypothetical protein